MTVEIREDSQCINPPFYLLRKRNFLRDRKTFVLEPPGKHLPAHLVSPITPVNIIISNRSVVFKMNLKDFVIDCVMNWTTLKNITIHFFQ